MGNNIFTKSMLRQPMRTILLILLIATASFAFVMRAVEYIVVTDRIDEISQFYRSIGFLSHDDDPLIPVDVAQGAEIIAASPQVAFEDRRRSAEGVLQNGLQNLDIEGMINRDTEALEAAFLQGGPLTAYCPQGAGDEFQWRLTDAFFYGELMAVSPDDENRFIQLDIRVETILLGYPEHLAVGRPLALRYYLREGETESTPVDSMVVGQRYFLRGGYFHRYLFHRVWDTYMLEMRPVNEVTYDPLENCGRWRRHLKEEAIWYIPVDSGSALAVSDADLAELITEEMARARHSQSAIQLITTADMTAMPSMHPRFGRQRIIEGRAIDRDDYLNALPVAVVYRHFAGYRGLQLGDTLSIALPANQRIVGYMYTDAPHFITMARQPAQYTQVLELEIVGMWSFGEPFSPSMTHCTTMIYIPDSVLPSDFTLLPSEILRRRLPVDSNFLANATYSFVLRDTRDEEAFLLAHIDELLELGFGLDFIPSGARNFWDSAEPILQSVTFNLILFCLALVLLLALVSFLYLQQRRREIAILRALGCPAKQIHRQLLLSLLLFGFPAVSIGGAGGWFYALHEAVYTLSSLEDILEVETIYAVSLSAHWLILFIALAFLTLLTMVLVGGRQITHHPLLSLLQGDRTAKRKGRKQVPPVSAANMSPAALSFDFSAFDSAHLKLSSKAKLQNALQYIGNHIRRAKLKSVLVAAMALAFLLALSFLQESIYQTEQEIDRLYNTTIVRGEILAVREGHDVEAGAIMRKSTIDALLETGFTQNEFFEAGYHLLLTVPADPEGNLPENWAEIIFIDPELGSSWHFITSTDFTIAPNDLALFTAAHSRDVFDGAVTRLLPDGAPLGDFHIDFAEGFDASSFVFTEGHRIPLIASPQRCAGRAGLNLGDEVYLAVYNGGCWITRGEWFHLPAVVIGIHNQNILMLNNRDALRLMRATLMPRQALHALKGDDTAYISARFDIDPALNRELPMVEEELRSIVEPHYAGFTALRLLLHDEELRAVVAPMEENLSLLQMLYPVAIGLFVLIALVFSMILMLQNAKNAAIIRVLGASKARARAMLWLEPMIVCLLGLAAGFGSVLALGWGFGTTSALGLAGLYFAGAAAGSALAAVLITNRPPLDLLQVKE